MKLDSTPLWATLLALCSLTSSIAYAAANEPNKAIDEVEVTGHIDKLRLMRDEMVKIEDKFYSEYNKLNKDKQFAVNCVREAPLGTRLKHRICRPAFMEDATSDEARSFFDGTNAPPASLVINAKWGDYKKNVLAIINGNKKLLKLVKEREAMEKRYEEARKKKFKGKIVEFEKDTLSFRAKREILLN